MSIEDILNKLSSEELSKEEREMLEIWKNESVDNAKALQQLHQISDVNLEDYKSYDVDNAWEKVSSKIEKSPSTYSLGKWALAFFIIAGVVAFGYFTLKDKEPAYPQHYASAVNKKDINLEDGTIVTLDKASSINIDDPRSVVIEKGRAYFDVTRDEDNPFTVKTSKGYIEVLGTEFSVLSTEDLVEVMVTEGTVRYVDGNRKVALSVGDYIKVADGNITKLSNHESNYLSWKDDKLIFRNTPLTTVIEDIERHYGQKIVIKDIDNSVSCRLTSTFQNQSLKEVLTELKSVLGVKFTRNGDIFEIVEIDCE